MADIRINQLPAAAPPVATDVVPIDSSAAGTTRKVPIQDLVVIGRPTASQAEAETATDPLKVMTPLTTGQAVSFYGLTKAGNLAGLADPSIARTNLGLNEAWLIAAIEAAIPFLPTSLPGSPNKLWNNGGLLSIS